MKFKQLIEKRANDFETIWNRLVEIYPDQSEGYAGYLNVFVDLLQLKPTESEFSVYVSTCEDFFDYTKYIDVSGKKEGDPFLWALDFTDWAEWLGMDVESEFDELTTIACCLWEMTFHGYSREAVKEKGTFIDELYEDAMLRLN